MSPSDPTDTGRFWLEYSDGIHPHVQMWRYKEGTASLADVMTTIDAYLTALAPDLYTLTILGAHYSGQGDHVSAPVTWTGASTYGAGGAAPALSGPYELRYEGRSVPGKRGAIVQYGYSGGLSSTFRATITVGSVLDDALQVLIAGTSAGAPVAVDNNPMIWKTYVNLQFNSYWETKQRP